MTIPGTRTSLFIVSAVSSRNWRRLRPDLTVIWMGRIVSAVASLLDLRATLEAAVSS